MLCPACGNELNKVAVTGFDDSHQCPKCGGLWVANWVVNNVAAGKPIKAETAGGESGLAAGVQPTNICPLDRSKLSAPAAETMPTGVAALRCEMCGGWWFGKGELQKLQSAYLARAEYERQWKKPNWTAFAWPALVLAIMVAGIGGSVTLVRQQQRAAIQASYGVREMVVLNLGRGEVEIRFKANVPIGTAEFRKSDSRVWSEVGVEQEEGGFKIRLKGLAADQEYLVRIAEKEYKFTVR